jgi:DNA-directed RNA polymerase subunit beta
MTQKVKDVINFGREEKNLPELNLSLVQKESWELFLRDGIGEELEEISPIDDFTGKNWQLSLENPVLGESKITPKIASEKGLTYSIPLKITATLINKRTGEKKSQEVFLGEIPQMTLRGTFIVSGVERVVINQIVRSPGVYFSGDLDTSSGRMLFGSEVRPLRGSWLEFEIDKNNVISARIDRKRKVIATTILRAAGLEKNEEILETFKNVDTDEHHKYISSTLDKDETRRTRSY